MLSALRPHTTAAVLRDAGAGPEQPAAITDTEAGRGFGEPATRRSPFISCNFQKLSSSALFWWGFFPTNILGKATHSPPTQHTLFFFPQDQKAV